METIEKALDTLSGFIMFESNRYYTQESRERDRKVVDDARAKLAELKKNLKDIEFVYNKQDCESGFFFCPVCDNRHGEHNENCWLSKAIRG